MNESITTYWKSLACIVLAGSCSGIYFSARSFSAIRFYTDLGIDPDMVGSFSVSRLGGYLIVANLILITFWFLYSFGYSRFSGSSFKNILRVDAYTYLPLCILAIALFQYDTPVTKGLLLLSQSTEYLLLLSVFMAICYVKIHTCKQKNEISSRAASSQVTAITWKSRWAIFLISFLVYALVGSRLIHRLEPVGDEPHYLLITHSLWYDHDLKILNNYTQRDYKAFFQGEMSPHVSIGKDGTRYPGHPIGLPVLLLPFYAIRGRQGAVLVMNVLAAFLALQLYELAFSLTHNRRHALMLWGITSFTLPLLLYSSQIFPEVPSALLLLIAYRLIRFPRHSCQTEERNQRDGRLLRSFILGGVLAMLLWIQQRMILPTLFLVLYDFATSEIWKKPQRDARTILSTITPLLFVAFSGIGMIGFYYTLYGNPLPNAPYVSVGIETVFSPKIFLKQGMLGLLLDQEGGLLVYSPHYILIFAGFFLLVRHQFKHAGWLLLLIASIYVPCAGFTLEWRGASSPVLRYMVAMIPFLFPLLTEAVKQMTRSLHRYIWALLVAISFFWSDLFVREPFRAIMRGRGINSFLELCGNRVVDPSQYLPSFTDTSSTGTYILAGLWGLGILIFSISLYSSTKTSFRISRGHKRASQIPTEAETQAFSSLRNVFGIYGGLIVGLTLLAFVVDHIESNIPSYVSGNKHVRNFLFNFERYLPFMRPERMKPGKFRFEYLDSVRQGRVEPGGDRFLVSGPYEAFPAGKYTAYFEVAVEENVSEDPAITIEISTDQGKHVLSRMFLRERDFKDAGLYEIVAILFELPGDVIDLETRVFFHNFVNINVRKVFIQPDLAEFFYLAGLAAFREESYEKAKKLFFQALSISKHAYAAYYIGVIEQLTSQWEDSRQFFEEALEYDPTFADAYYRLGMAFQKRYDSGRAREYFEHTITLLPSHIDAWTALHDLYRQAGLEEQATRCEHAITELYDPQYPYTANIANQLMFMGYRLQNSVPGHLQIEYYWKALSPMKIPYAFFVHFKKGRTKFQHDHFPQIRDPLTGELRPYSTNFWQIGEVVHETFALSGPAGAFTIQLGVWDPFYTKTRLPVYTSSSTLFGQPTIIELEPVTLR